MYSYVCDYSEGAYPKILKAIIDANLVQTPGYGDDEFTFKAVEVIKEKLEDDSIDVHFVVGGTQANLICLSSFLRPHEAIIASDEGHIFTHETGAIEATGHKIIDVKNHDGKLNAKQIMQVLDSHVDEHMVKPKLVFISNSTELGSIYSLDELYEIKRCCSENNLLLYLDGARLGSALMSNENDIKLSDLCKIFDAFYIGGTKNGALFGEAIVIVNDDLKEDFRYLIKQKGALLAKGKLIGIQFFELFKDDLYFKLAKHANIMASAIKNTFINEGYKLYSSTSTNQVFVIINNEIIDKFKEKYLFIDWCKYDDNNRVYRFVTSWATTKEEVVKLMYDIKEFNKMTIRKTND